MLQLNYHIPLASNRKLFIGILLGIFICIDAMAQEVQIIHGRQVRITQKKEVISQSTIEPSEPFLPDTVSAYYWREQKHIPIKIKRYELGALLPYPASDNVKLTIKSPRRRKAMIKVFHPSGELQFTQAIRVYPGINEIPIPLYTLNRGSYDILVTIRKWNAYSFLFVDR